MSKRHTILHCACNVLAAAGGKVCSIAVLTVFVNFNCAVVKLVHELVSFENRVVVRVVCDRFNPNFGSCVVALTVVTGSYDKCSAAEVNAFIAFQLRHTVPFRLAYRNIPTCKVLRKSYNVFHVYFSVAVDVKSKLVYFYVPFCKILRECYKVLYIDFLIVVYIARYKLYNAERAVDNRKFNVVARRV